MMHTSGASRILAHCGFFLMAATASAFAGDPTGDWRVADGVANIRVAECHGSMWGAVSWEKIPGGTDSNNPDPAKQSRPTLGMPVLLDMKRTKPNVDQWAGEVYNAKDGKRYESTITLKNPNELEIEGCVLGFLCGGETWIRISGPIPSSPSNALAEAPKAGGKGAASKSASHGQPAPAPKSAARSATGKTVGQRQNPTSGSTDAADSVGDICLLPGIARASH